MAITDIQISEELMTNAPSIKYSGNEGPKSPQEMEMMMMSGGQPLPEDPTKPVNPFAPKPTGPTLPNKKMAFDDTPGFELEELRLLIDEFESDNGRPPRSIDDLRRYFYIKYGDDRISEMEEMVSDRQTAAYGGIMGADGRKQYGIGSFFQKYIKDPIEMAITGKSYQQLEDESQARVDREPEGYEGVFDRLFKGEKGKDKQGKETRTGGLDKYIIPAIGGITAGLFTKKNQSGSSGGQPTADETALMLADLKKSANILDQKQGLAAGLNFLPAVSARKFTPDEMIETYKTTAANGGRIGMAEGGLMDLGGMEKDYRAEGGFVPIGKREKADDVPARLSVNEFVFTADAVRNAGGGDIDRGAQVMENMMKHLEAGGQVSKESQGMQGARDMFEVSERLSEVV
jgi:hypothetical protein